MIIKRIFEGKRTTAKWGAIAEILRAFSVFPVMNHGKGYACLEVFGKKPHVLVAEHVGLVLDRELETLWIQTQKMHPHLKGLTSKNSFFRGVADGYTKKAMKLKRSIIPEAGLMVIEKSLVTAAEMAYPHLKSRTVSHRHDPNSSKLGKTAGGKLKIQKAVEKEMKKGRNFLNFYG